MAVGLGEHERHAPGHRGEPDRAGDVAAGAEHRVGAHVAQDPPRRAHRGRPRRSAARAAFSGLLRLSPSTAIGRSS